MAEGRLGWSAMHYFFIRSIHPGSFPWQHWQRRFCFLITARTTRYAYIKIQRHPRQTFHLRAIRSWASATSLLPRFRLGHRLSVVNRKGLSARSLQCSLFDRSTYCKKRGRDPSRLCGTSPESLPVLQLVSHSSQPKSGSESQYYFFCAE